MVADGEFEMSDHRALIEQARDNPLAKELRWLASHADTTRLTLQVEYGATGKGMHALAPETVLDLLGTFARLADALEHSIAYAINRAADLRLERDAALARLAQAEREREAAEARGDVWHADAVERARDQSFLRVELAAARKALEFYADERHYDPELGVVGKFRRLPDTPDGPGEVIFEPDGGDVAVAALAALAPPPAPLRLLRPGPGGRAQPRLSGRGWAVTATKAAWRCLAGAEGRLLIPLALLLAVWAWWAMYERDGKWNHTDF